ncbi:BQ5605_C002g01028 [Microbotryum silenes-dioicae]|uniref:BQ5605_C002g01028 protein n=1 Tax=Microbotryum silenes-dioicae TaxID=796604 RepID=A0A2X0P0V8_9BASI|nr:BQ5605_C002g01028 [Microbotryum silenes-dioicae]
MELVSKPSRKVVLDKEELSRFVRGSRVKFVRGLGMGEVALVRSGEATWVEAREAVRKGLGGEVVARVG